MDQELQKIYNQYIESGNTETPEQFLEAKDQMGDQVFFDFINSQIDLKKKDDTQVTPENLSTVENGINTEASNPIIPEPVTEQFQGIPMNQVDPRFEQAITQPLQPIQDSLELDSILPVNFTVSESILPKINKSSFEKTINQNKNSFEFLAGKPDENDVLYTDTSFDNQSQEELAKKSKEEANFNEFLLKYTDKDYFNSDIQPAPFNSVIVSTEPDIEKGNQDILELEKNGVVNIERNQDGTLQLQDGKVKYRITDKNYYDSTYIPYIAELNNIASDQNIDSARFNFGNMDNPLLVSERDQYANELQKEYGILLDNDQRRLLYSQDSRKDLEINLEVEKRLKENPALDYNTVLNQVTADKNGISPQQKEAIGTDYIQRMLIGGDGVFDTLHTEDTQDELKFYQDYFRTPENRQAFGEFMNDEGKAVYDTSWMRRNNTAKRQEKRKELFESFIAWKGKQDRLDYAFSEEAFRDAETRAEAFRKTNNIEGLRNEINEMKKYEAQMRVSNVNLQNKINDFDNAQQYYSKTNQEKKVKEDFQMRVQNDEFGANAENFIGNILLGAETSVQNAATGLLRIAATPFGKGNVNDAIDIISEPISVGKVDIARISDEVITYSQGNNTYREINGRLYQVAKDGKIFRPDIIPAKENLTEVDRERDINVSGLAFVTSKMLADIYITQRVGRGINGRIANFANSVNNSKIIAGVFGEGSQIANQAANLSRVMKGANSNMITGWTVQQYNDNYLAAKNGGIENETNRHLYAFATSFLLAQIQRINPDTNFLKSINSEYKSVVSSLLENNSQKALIAVESFVKKAAKNTAGETAEELVQQGTQDVVNMFINTVGNKDLRVSTENDYKDVVVGTIVPSIIASAFGGSTSRVNIEGRSLDLTNMTRNELVTELARTEKGTELLKDFRENTYFESLQNESDKLVLEVQERKKYINKIPDSENYSTEQINNTIPLLQQIENLKREKQKDDGTFAEKIDTKITDIRNQINTILNNDSNENPQSVPQPKTVQEQATTAQSEPQQTETPTNTESSVNETQNNNTQSEQGAVIQNPDIPSDLNTQQNETAQNNTDIIEPTITETPVQPVNQTNDNVADSTTSQSENTQSPQAEISPEIFNDNIDLADLNEEQIPETERQIESAAALFASFNETEQSIKKIEKSRISSNGKYNIVEKTDNIGNKTFELFDINDQPIQLSNKQKNLYVAEYINAQEYPQTEIDIAEGITENDLDIEIISKSENPKEIAQIILSTPRFDSSSVAGSKDWAISQVLRGNNVNRDSFIENDDRNNITNGIARTYFAKSNGGKSIDNLAQEASEQFTSDYNSDSVTIQDVIDFIKRFLNDPTKAERPNNPLYDSAVEKFIKLTGENPTKNLLNKLISNNENNYSDVINLKSEYDNISSQEQNNLINEYNNWFNSLSLDQKLYELENTFYENNSTGNTKQENSSNEDESSSYRQGERNQDATNKNAIQRQKSETQFTRITQEAFDALIERLKKPFSKAFSNLNVTSYWNEFQEKAKTLGLKDDQIQRLQSNFSYRMDHSAPTRDNGDNALYDLIDVYGEDIYGSNAIKYFGEGDAKIDKESISVIQSIRDNPDAEITIYRAVPKNVSDINTGDWVSISRQYAVNHGEIWLKGDYSILEKKVKASQVFTDGNSISEQGVQFMQNANGTVYGAKLPDGTIYINPNNLNANTAIHEFSHLWEQVMPSAWKRGLEIFKQTNTGKRLFNQIKSEGNYASLSDDMIWSEALNTHIGNYGEWRNSNPRSKMKEFADWLKNIFTRLGNAFGIKTNPETSLKQFTEGVVGDLLGGKEISTEANPALSSNLQFSIVSKKPMPNSTFAAVVNATSSGGKEAGYNALAESSWYKSLSENQKAQITVDNFQNTMLDQAQIYREKIQENKNKSVAKVREAANNTVKRVKKEAREQIKDIISEYKDKIKSIKNDANKTAREKSLEQKRALRLAVKDIKSHLAGTMYVGRITPAETNRLIRKASEIGTRKDISKAVQEFTDLYDAIKAKAESRLKQKEFSLDEYNEIKPLVENLKNEGKTIDEIYEKIKSLGLSNKRPGVLNDLYQNQITNIFNDLDSAELTPEQAYQQMKEKQEETANAMNDSRTRSEKLRDKMRQFIKNVSDRQFVPKKILQEIGAGNTVSRMIAMAGSSARAREVYSKLDENIFEGLKAEDKKELNAMIIAKRILSIEKNRSERELPPMKHPYANPKKALEGMKQKLGEEKFKDLENRTEEYFKAFKGILTEMRDNGLISQDAYENMIDIDYQPRLFIDRLLDADGNLDPDGNFQNFSGQNGGLKSEILKSLGDGSDSAIIDNAEWLLKTAISSRYKAMAMNEVNRRFMTDEYWKAKDRFDAIDPKDFKNKSDQKFYNYFKELQSKIKDNPIVGTTDTGRPKYKYETAPQGFTKAYYYVDGVRNEFFLADELHSEWHDVKEGLVFDPKAKGIINKWSGAALIKAMATGYNPTFAFTNTPRDFMQTLVFSPEYSNNLIKGIFQLGYDQVKAITRMFKSDFMGKEDAIFEKYISYGGGMDFLYVQGLLDKERKLSNAFQKILDSKVFEVATLMKLSKWSEMMTRMAIFERSVQNQLKDLGLKNIEELSTQQEKDDIYYKAVSSARSIMDFNQGGKLVKDLDTVMPYLNAATQGTRVALDSFRDRPLETSIRMFQAGGLMASTAIGVSYALLAAARQMGGEDDKDKKKSINEIILHTYDGLSQYQRANYINIILPMKDDKGEHRVFKIAKTQFVAPLSYIMEEGLLGVIRKAEGKEEKDFMKVMQETSWVANKNMTPIELASPSKFITSLGTKNPLMKAALTYTTGYDFFKEEVVTFDVKKSNFPRELEGYKDPKVEDFYKEIGSLTGSSPARMKAFVESIVTTPETNPFVTMVYGGADLTNAVIQGDSKAEVAQELKENISKVFTKRLIGQASDFNRMQREREKVNAEVEKAILKDEKLKLDTDILAKKIKDGKISLNEGVKEIKGMNLNADELEKTAKRLEKKLSTNISDTRIYDILYSTANSNQAKAILINTYFPEVFENSVEGNAIRAELQNSKLMGEGILKELIEIKQEQKK